MDNTLVDSPASVYLNEFIRNNPTIDHYIITFRTHGLVSAIPFDLLKYGTDISLFKQILSISKEAWVENEVALLKRKSNPNMPITREEIYYKTWKGRICSEHNIPVLIDDDEKNTKPGCDMYNIILIDPLVMIR